MKYLFPATLPVAAAVYLSLMRSLPGWVHIALGALGAGWWVCRYVQWSAWEACRKKRKRPAGRQS